MRESRRRLLRIVGVLGGVALLLAIAVFTILILELPSLSEVRETVTDIWPARVQVLTSNRPAPTPPPTATPVARAPAAVATPAPNVILSYLVERYVESADRDVRVCDNLAENQNPVPNNRDNFNQLLARQAQGLILASPFVESALAPIGQIILQPSVAALMGRIEDARATNDPAALTTPDFRGLLTLASSDFFANRSAFENSAQHAYHLYVISRLARINFTAANDSNVQALCGRIESLIENGSRESAANMDSEKAAVLRLISQMGFTAEQVGYDPNLRNEIRAEFTGQRIMVQIPWMNRIFGTSFDLRIR